MKNQQSFLEQGTIAPLLALLFASGVGVGLVACRVVISHSLQYTLLVWNLFLAWLPLVFALLARRNFPTGLGRPWKCLGFAGAWLLFFPNAPYIFTDLIHIRNNHYHHYWVDLLLVLVHALTGLVLGFVSLYLMQSLVLRRFGALMSWLFVVGTVGLSSFGIYLGRFVRLNSWDVLRPGRALGKLDRWPDNLWFSGHTALFLAMFAIFLFLAYVMLYALTHLPRTELARNVAPDV